MSYTGKHIAVMEGLIAMRHHKSMYVGECNLNGQLQIIKEVFDNCKDEHERMEPIEPIEILLCFFDNSYQIILIDHGRGIPVIDEEDPERPVLRLLSQVLHSSGKFNTRDSDSPYEAPTGTHGIGLKAAMGLSTHSCILTSHQVGQGYVQLLKDEEVAYKIENVTSSTTGTIVIFEPDPEMLSEIDLFSTQGIEQLSTYIEFISVFIEQDVRTKISLFDKRLNLNKFYSQIKGDLSKGFDIVSKIKRIKTIFEYKEKISLKSYLRKRFEIKQDFIWEMPSISKKFNPADEEDRLSYDVQLFLTDGLRVNKNGIMATVNMTMINDPSSHHISVLGEMIKSYLENFIPDNSIREYFRLLYKLPFYTVVRVRFKGASFLDQTKKGFKDQAFVSAYKASLTEEYNKLPVEIWEGLFDILYPDIERRYKENYNKNYVSAQGLKNIGLRLHNYKNYKSCTSKDKNSCELYLVEGQSAFDSAARACNNLNQAVYALQGKPINGIRCNDKEFFENVFIEDLMAILGITNKDTNLDNMNFDKIYLLADADDHGYHICVLIVGNLYKLNPLLLEQGRVYLSNPPLHSLAVNKKVIYLKDNNALMEMKVKSLYSAVFKIHGQLVGTGSGIKTIIEGETFLNLCHMIIHICSLIEEASAFIGMKPEMLEIFLRNLDCIDGEYVLDLPSIKTATGAQAIEEKNDFITLSIDALDLTIPWKRMREECKKYLYRDFNQFKCKTFQLYITTLMTDAYKESPISLYSLYKIMKTLDSKLGRFSYFKGLGEMESYQLRETCFNPNTKSAVRITCIGELNRIYGMLDVDTKMRKQLTEIF